MFIIFSLEPSLNPLLSQINPFPHNHISSPKVCFTLTSTQYCTLEVSVSQAIISLQNIQIVFHKYLISHILINCFPITCSYILSFQLHSSYCVRLLIFTLLTNACISWMVSACISYLVRCRLEYWPREWPARLTFSFFFLSLPTSSSSSSSPPPRSWRHTNFRQVFNTPSALEDLGAGNDNVLQNSSVITNQLVVPTDTVCWVTTWSDSW